MKTKLILFTTIIILTGFIQSNAQAIFGIKAGLNEANLVSKYGGVTTTYNSKSSFHLGVTVELPVSENISVEPGLLLSGKGGKDVEDGYKDEIISMNYLDLPINFLYKYPIRGSEFQVFGYAGPYAGFLISAKDKVDKQSTDVKKYFKKIDGGINIGAGVQLSNITFGLQYEFGLANLATGDGTKSTNRMLSISIGYKFGD